MLLQAPAPKEEAKYTGFTLATEKRAYERVLQEQERERAAHIAKLAAAAAAVAAPDGGDAVVADATAGAIAPAAAAAAKTPATPERGWVGSALGWRVG